MGLPDLARFKKRIVESFENKKQTPKNLEKLGMLKSKFNNEQVLKQKEEDQWVDIEEEEYGQDNPHLREKKKYNKELKKVIEASDIILEILDARDPLGCRNKDIEALIQSMNGEKKIILVVNKIDLVPPENAELWLNYLRREYATVLFKSNTQSQNSNLSGSTLFKKTFNSNVEMTEQMLSSNKAVGADNLLQLIKNYSKKEGVKHAVTVGLVGYPNVGKSSVINSLKRTKSVGVSSVPGYTKHMQEISLDKKVKLLDCPGVVFSGEEEAQMILRNIIKLENVVDPVSPIKLIIEKIGAQTLMDIYKIEPFKTPLDFIIKVGSARGQVKKGGAIDMEKTARLILNDWNSGKIKYFTHPPMDNKMILE